MRILRTVTYRNGGQRSTDGAEGECFRLAWKQHGVVSREQVVRLGLSERWVDRRVADGRLIRLHPGVYVIAGAPSSWLQSVMGACLWAGSGAAASHRSAAAIWQLDGARERTVEITSSRHLRSRRVKVHRRPLEDWEITKRQCVPVTKVERTLLDLGSCVSAMALEIALDSALRRHLTAVPRLHAHLIEMARNGVPGTRALRRLLQERDPSIPPRESPLETRLGRLLREWRLPAPAAQFIVRSGNRFVARLDFAYPEKRLAIEADGYEFHQGRLRWKRDLKRRNDLTSLRWRVLSFTKEDLTALRDATRQTVLDAYAQPAL